MTANNKKKLVELIASDSDNDDSTNIESSKKSKISDLNINKNYAQRYDAWRSKEELQKCNFFIAVLQNFE